MYKVVRDWTREYLKRKKAVRDMRKRRGAFQEPRHRLYDKKKNQFYYQRENESKWSWFVRLEEHGIPNAEDYPLGEYLGYNDVNGVEVYSDDFTDTIEGRVHIYGNYRQNPELLSP